MLLFIRCVFVSDYQEYWRENILFTFAKGLLAELGVEYGRNIWEWIVEFNFRKSFGKCIKLNSCPLPFLPSVLCNSIWAVWSVSSFLSGEPSRLCHHFKSTIDRGVNCITLPTTLIQSTFFKPLPCNFVPASITIVMFFHYLSLELLSMFKICLSTESWRQKRPLRIWLLGSLFETLSFGGEFVTLWALPELKGDWKVWSSSRWRKRVVLNSYRLSAVWGGTTDAISTKGMFAKNYQ